MQGAEGGGFARKTFGCTLPALLQIDWIDVVDRAFIRVYPTRDSLRTVPYASVLANSFLLFGPASSKIYPHNIIINARPQGENVT